MNAPVEQGQFDISLVGSGEFYRLRSDCIDAFASLETSVYRLASILKIQADSRGQFSQLIKKLKAAPASPQLSKENAAKLKACCEEVASLLGQRADIVHSRMVIVQDGTENLAIFRNSVAVSSGSCDARVYEMRTLIEVARKTVQLAVRFDGLRNPQPKAALA